MDKTKVLFVKTEDWVLDLWLGLIIWTQMSQNLLVGPRPQGGRVNYQGPKF